MDPAARQPSHPPRPQGNNDTTTNVTLDLTCDRRDEAHIRALLIQMLSSTGPQLAGRYIRRADQPADHEDRTRAEHGASV